MQSRWTSKVVWGSILAAVLSAGQPGPVGSWHRKGSLQHMIDAVLALLVAFGVLNNPTDAEHF